MPLLPVICITCRRVYRFVDITRELRRADEHADGICPTCMQPNERRLFGRHVMSGVIVKKFCGCGLELVTAQQIMDGRCECCPVAMVDVEAWR